MSNVLDKSFIHRSYPKLAYGSIYANSQTNISLIILPSGLRIWWDECAPLCPNSWWANWHHRSWEQNHFNYENFKRIHFEHNSDVVLSVYCGPWRFEFNCHHRWKGQKKADRHWTSVSTTKNTTVTLSHRHQKASMTWKTFIGNFSN